MGEDTAEGRKARRKAALRGCERVLSQGAPPTLRERLDRLTTETEDVYDLDGWPDVYGDGPVAAVEWRVAELLGTEDAAFFPTGTMAQQVALRCWAERTGSPVVAMHPRGHLDTYERRAYAVLSGLRAVHPTTAPRNPTAQEVLSLDEPFGTLMLELPLREAGFVLPSWDGLASVVEAAREREAVVHFDGARLWESATWLGRPLPEIAALADTVYVSFYKSLGGISGAALAGPSDLVAQAAAWRHRYGGQLFQQWPAALAALAGMERELPRLESYVAHAPAVAGALAKAFEALPWSRVHPDPPHTHQFQVWLPYPADVLDEAGVRMAEETGTALFGSWREPDVPGLSMTEVTVAASALAWSAGDVAAAAAAFLDRLAAIAADG